MKGYKIYDNDRYCASCYFRTIAPWPNKKCLIQLTERCNLHCEHCFVSADHMGDDIDFNRLKNSVIPVLIKGNVTKVTLTGGEPLLYRQIIDVIRLLDENKIGVSICTNATLISDELLKAVSSCDDVHFNVSLDGFSPSSHGKFRGNESPSLFYQTLHNIEMIGKLGLLNGILVTPNVYADMEEYISICRFALENRANYVLMNPLSQFGRGEKTIGLAYSKSQMRELYEMTKQFNCESFEVVYIRFPNSELKPLSGCSAGDILYLFSNGDLVVCPYMAFATRDQNSKYEYDKFLLGNAFSENFDLLRSLDEYILPVSESEICKGCTFENCQKGCYAAKIASGNRLEDSDVLLCPLRYSNWRVDNAIR